MLLVKLLKCSTAAVPALRYTRRPLECRERPNSLDHLKRSTRFDRVVAFSPYRFRWQPQHFGGRCHIFASYPPRRSIFAGGDNRYASKRCADDLAEFIYLNWACSYHFPNLAHVSRHSKRRSNAPCFKNDHDPRCDRRHRRGGPLIHARPGRRAWGLLFSCRQHHQWPHPRTRRAQPVGSHRVPWYSLRGGTRTRIAVRTAKALPRVARHRIQCLELGAGLPGQQAAGQHVSKLFGAVRTPRLEYVCRPEQQPVK